MVCPAHSRMFSCIPGLYPVDASSTPTPTSQELRQQNLPPNLAKYPLKVKSAQLRATDLDGPEKSSNELTATKFSHAGWFIQKSGQPSF